VYLKVVGIDQDGHIFPYTDPDFPSFILEIPACTSSVTIPEPLYPLIHSEEFDDEDKEAGYDCWAC
jgi:hypothetical protein